MNIIKYLPDDIKYQVFKYTNEYYRTHCKRRGFKRLASESNDIFPESIFQEDISYKTVYQDWKVEKKLRSINNENYQYIKYGLRPSLQYCNNDNNNYLESLYPNKHFSLSIFGINTFQQLISYSIRLLNYGYNVILFLKPIHYQTFIQNFDKRLLEHSLDTDIKYEYITLNHVSIPKNTKILISILGSKRLKQISKFIRNNLNKGTNTYILNYIQLNINQEGIGSGIYDIKQ